MLKRFILFLGIMMTIIACNYGPAKKPKNLISKKEMVKILIDAKMIASANSINKKVFEKNGVYVRSYIFEKYNIDSAQFAESNTYYTYNIKEYQEIYLAVKDSLDKLKTKLKEIQDKEREAAEKKSKDSLDKVLKKRDSLKLSGKDSLVVKKLKDSLAAKELEELDINEEDLELIESISNNLEN